MLKELISTGIVILLLCSFLLFPIFAKKPVNNYNTTIHQIADKYHRPVDEVRNIVNIAAVESERRSIPLSLTLAIIATESNFNPKAENPSSAAGLMQVLQHMHKRRFQEYGGGVFDPETNIKTGLDILATFWNWTHSEADAVSHYGGDLSGAYYNKVLKNRQWILETMI